MSHGPIEELYAELARVRVGDAKGQQQEPSGNLYVVPAPRTLRKELLQQYRENAARLVELRSTHYELKEQLEAMRAQLASFGEVCSESSIAAGA